jgi:RNA polymerase sigma factor (sigma-70 family)
MEHIIVDYVRARRAMRRGGGCVESLDGIAQDGHDPAANPSARKNYNWVSDRAEDVIAVHELLDRLETSGAEAGGKSGGAQRQAEIVRLRFFLGLTEDETANILGCSSETVTKEFKKAKAKLAQ